VLDPHEELWLEIHTPSLTNLGTIMIHEF
jgi:hypothetical protein